MRFRLVLPLILLLSAVPARLSAGEAADKYLGYRWATTPLSSYQAKEDGPQVQANMDAFTTLVREETAEGEGKYLRDILNGFWFYATAYSWSLPSETGWKLPPKEGQQVTPTTAKTAAMLREAWGAYSGKMTEILPSIGEMMQIGFKRITGEDL